MYEINELANIVPMAVEAEQMALTKDIEVNGQNDTAKLWRGQIVDGRCRQLACTSLGIELKVEHLDDNLSESDVRKMVKSWNTRRNLTMTQKVISAHYEYLRNYGTLTEVAKAWAISRATLANANYIGEHRPELVVPLFNGESVVIYDYDKKTNITTNRVNTVAKLIRQDIDRKANYIDNSKEVEYKYTVASLPLSSVSHSWIGSKLTEYDAITEDGKRSMMTAMLIELAKYKEKENTN